jgi:tripartite-type tricarboxylate transporter receptor subunit TctC
LPDNGCDIGTNVIRLHHRTVLAAIAMLGPALTVPLAAAQSYPARPIRMVVGVVPGGATDMLARIVGAKLSERFSQQVVIDNRPGPSSIVGSDIVARSPADGHTLLMSSSGLSIVGSLYKKVPFDSVKDFDPIAFIATTPYVFVVHPSLPVKTMSGLIDYAKAQPGKLTYAASTPGTTQHLGAELFQKIAGINMLYIPYKGSGAVLPDLLSGRLQVGIDNVLVVMQHVRRGAMRGLAVTSLTRSQAIPELPTVSEAAIPDFEAIGWFGVFAPARTPPPIIKQLNAEIAAIMMLPDVNKRLVEQGAEPVSAPPEELRKLLAREIAKWSKVIREVGIDPN